MHLEAAYIAVGLLFMTDRSTEPILWWQYRILLALVSSTPKDNRRTSSGSFYYLEDEERLVIQRFGTVLPVVSPSVSNRLVSSL